VTNGTSMFLALTLATVLGIPAADTHAQASTMKIRMTVEDKALIATLDDNATSRGNLAIFYRGAAYANGLIKLGTIESGIEALNRPGTFEVTIDRVAK
jgi:hypothetical protein